MPHTEEALTRTAYDAVADLYADRITGTGPEQPLDLAVIDHFVTLLEKPAAVLDAGCGAGRMLPYLADRGCTVEGIDLSPEMVRRANTDHSSFTVRVGTLTDLPHGDASFDGVFSWYSTIHNPDHDLDRMLAEMARVLRPGGHLLLAFQAGHGMRDVGHAFVAHGYDVTMNRYHRTLSDMTERLKAQGLQVSAQLERAPVVSERDAQAFVIGRRPEWSART